MLGCVRERRHASGEGARSRRPRSGVAKRAAAAAACVAVLGGCAWHRVEPRLEAPPRERVRGSVGVAAADAGTSLSDLQAIARLWSSWESFERVQFPFREGDPVELVVEVTLRQRADGHRGANALRAVLNGLTVGLLTPVIGARISEIHDVGVRCRPRDAAATTPVEFQVSTDLEMGMMANVANAAKALDDEEMKRVASAVLRAVRSGCASPVGADLERGAGAPDQR